MIFNYTLSSKTKGLFVTFSSILIFLFSCGSGNGNKGDATSADSQAVAPKPAFDTALVKGRVTDSIICRNQNIQSYALYLPSYYSPAKQYPCIYFFDAHARGSIPLRMYKDIAEKYGFVLVGSDVSKNGIPWQTTNEFVKTLMEDTRSRINIDPKRIYTAGFSGGSRVASSIALLDGGVAGVIGCAGGFPTQENKPQNKFDFFGIVGNSDFNLIEMEHLDETLEQSGFAHQILTFDGIHGWAPASDFQTAILWMQVNAMKENLQPKDDAIITTLKNDLDKRVATAISSHNLLDADLLLAGLVRTLDALTDVSIYKKQLSDIAGNADFKNALVLHRQLQQDELGAQQELSKEFTTHDENWWTKKIADYNQKIHSSKTQLESQMNRRLLNFIGLIAYLNANHAINSGDITNAATYLKVFKLADPKNYDCSYLTALYYMKKGSSDQAISSLNEAAALGYSDVSQLTTDAAFNSLQNDPRFKKIVNKVIENYTSK